MLQSKTTHVSSTTPFKIINDENDFALSAKSKTKALKSSVKPVIGGKVSFENSTPALGKGILKNGTQRKALSSLSTSQVNTRLNTPGVGMSQTSKQGFNMSVYNDEAKVKKSFRTASSNTREGGEKCFVPTMVRVGIDISAATQMIYWDRMICNALARQAYLMLTMR